METTERIKDSKFYALFKESLQDIYWAEQALTQALPKMKDAATSTVLADAFQKHLLETQEHAGRLEQIFGILGEEATGKKCEAMAGLIKEGNSIIEDTDEDTAVRDAGLIMAAQKVEHYEIATYGALKSLAKRMGSSEISSLLDLTLKNEKETDDALTVLAEQEVNDLAASE
ncbi:MAG: ferritin-like domain-containing protein [Pedobacter sp.]|uniref:YciE/YciF ferroxidase family protein n=1 Tax=Pedobacter sp. TaxID=1411316 RepID=UPI00339810A1